MRWSIHLKCDSRIYPAVAGTWRIDEASNRALPPSWAGVLLGIQAEAVAGKLRPKSKMIGNTLFCLLLPVTDRPPHFPHVLNSPRSEKMMSASGFPHGLLSAFPAVLMAT